MKQKQLEKRKSKHSRHLKEESSVPLLWWQPAQMIK
jgi:hypothetical protein